MRKWLILLVIGVAVSVIYYLVITYVEYTPKWLAGEKTTVRRGNVRSPISASGRIEPAMRIEIKSEASGPVTNILVEEGDYVRAGQTLIVLDPNEETISRDKAQLAVEEAKKALSISEANAIKAKESGILRAKAAVQSAKARLTQATFEREKVERLDKQRVAADQEIVMARAAYEEALANHLAAEAGFRAAELDAQIAQEQAASARTTLGTAEQNFSDAQRRLSQTVIKAPSDGMVAKVMVQIGSLVQSGTRSLTGGTPLIKLADTSKLYVVAMVDDADFGVVRRIAPPSARPQMRPGPARTRERTTTDAAPPDPVPSGASTLPAPPMDPTQRVKVTVDTFPDEEFWGLIERIDPEGEVHGAIVQYRVHVLLTSPNSYDLLQLGLPAQVEFTAESRENVLIVESRCVRKQGEEFGVYMPDPTPQDKLRTKFIRVRTGISDGTNTEILEPSELKEGDEVYRSLPASPEERGKK